jgi:hypothetical protein
MDYDGGITAIAKWLARGDRFLAEDLRSEMHIAVMRRASGNSRHFYLHVAKCRAIDYLRYRSRHYSYDGVIKHVSLESIRTTGCQIDIEGNVYRPKMDRTMTLEDPDSC